MIETQSGKLYTGITTDVERRFQEHCGEGGKNKGAKFFRTDKPNKIVYKNCLLSRGEATKLEMEIKKKSRKEKLVFIGGGTI